MAYSHSFYREVRDLSLILCRVLLAFFCIGGWGRSGFVLESFGVRVFLSWERMLIELCLSLPLLSLNYLKDGAPYYVNSFQVLV